MKTGNSKQANSIHVVLKDGRHKVYDAQGRYRCSFATKEQADAFACALAGGPTHTQETIHRPFAATESQQ